MQIGAEAVEEAVADLSLRSRAGSFRGTQALVWVQSCLEAGRSPTGEHRNEVLCPYLREGSTGSQPHPTQVSCQMVPALDGDPLRRQWHMAGSWRHQAVLGDPGGAGAGPGSRALCRELSLPGAGTWQLGQEGRLEGS